MLLLLSLILFTLLSSILCSNREHVENSEISSNIYSSYLFSMTEVVDVTRLQKGGILNWR